MGYSGRKFDQNDSRGGGNKWGGGGPKSLMDVNFNGNSYRPRGPPPNQQGGGGGWNQNRPRGGGPRGSGPRGNSPWQSGPPPRG